MRIMHHLKPLSFFIFLLFSSSPPHLSSSSSFTKLHSLSQGFSIPVDKPNRVLVSPDGSFTAGFQSVGRNAYCFAVWFSETADKTIIWMANRDRPVRGRRSALSLQKDGNLVLTDAGIFNIWMTNTVSTTSAAALRLVNTGNLVLQTSSSDNEYETLWQSFDFPTDTLLPHQPLTRYTKLVSRRSRYNQSSGFYSLLFNNDNVLSLLYNGPQVSSIYWPDPWKIAGEVGRTSFNNSRIALFTSSGRFESSDEFDFMPADYGIGPMRRLTIDFDGGLRVYSLDEKVGIWVVSWRALPPCRSHGLCGPNGICVYELEKWTCRCPPGFKAKDATDLSLGCLPTLNFSCNPQESKFLSLRNVDYYGYDLHYFRNITLESCRSGCLNLCTCKGFVYRIEKESRCYHKATLFNGRRSPSFKGTMYIKVPTSAVSVVDDEDPLTRFELNCSDLAQVNLGGIYEELKDGRDSFNYLLWFASVMGLVELVCITMGWFYLYKTREDSNPTVLGNFNGGSGFRRFTYVELKKATSKFYEEIGRGGGGIVYKGVLADGRVAAVKRLRGLDQGEEEFLAEVGTIGRINHINLIQLWGFCAEGNHKLLVYEYMEHGSLAKNLSSNVLDWEKRFEIAVGTAKGLAYLHDQCLEWVLHCDIKPQNILLDANLNAKVADFGLSKLCNRGRSTEQSFSKVRGTRGYMAPEWVWNLPITSKVDVYSYGIVLLEMVTGRCSTEILEVEGVGGKEYNELVPWVKEIMGSSSTSGMPWGIEEIVDPRLIEESHNHKAKIEVLISVALQCVEKEKDARPTMSQALEKLLFHEY